MRVLTELHSKQAEFKDVKKVSQSGGHLNLVFDDFEALRSAISKVTNMIVQYGYVFDMEIESNMSVLRLSQDWQILIVE